METLCESFNNNLEEKKLMAKEIGREFVKHYYTVLSEKPHEAGRFYSHESYFIHHDLPEACGAAQIQQTINSIGFENCKARIFSLRSMPTVKEGLLFQVDGELTVQGVERRFSQTFLLIPQSSKKYYVHNDILQWFDDEFAEQTTHQRHYKNSVFNNGPKAAKLNKNSTPSIAAKNGFGEKTKAIDEQHIDALSKTKTVEEHTLCAVHPVAASSPVKNSEGHSLESKEPIVEKEFDAKASHLQPLSMTSSGKRYSDVVQANKSVATLASLFEPTSGKSSSPPRQAHSITGRLNGGVSVINRPPEDSLQNDVDRNGNHQQHFSRGNSNQHYDRNRFFGRSFHEHRREVFPKSEHTLYVANIPRPSPQVDWESLKVDLTNFFTKYGKVLTVSIPLSVQNDLHSNDIYTFVDMEHLDSIAKVIDETTLQKDGTETKKYLNVTLPSVNFKGEVRISNHGTALKSSQSYERGVHHGGGRGREYRNFNRGGRSAIGGRGGNIRISRFENSGNKNSDTKPKQEDIQE